MNFTQGNACNHSTPADLAHVSDVITVRFKEMANVIAAAAPDGSPSG
jgi:hypothetical protein